MSAKGFPGRRVEAMRAASVDDLCKIPGIGRAKAALLREKLRGHRRDESSRCPVQAVDDGGGDPAAGEAGAQAGQADGLLGGDVCDRLAAGRTLHANYIRLSLCRLDLALQVLTGKVQDATDNRILRCLRQRLRPCAADANRPAYGTDLQCGLHVSYAGHLERLSLGRKAASGS